MVEENKKPIFDEIATSSKATDIYAGWLSTLENPDPTLLSEANGIGLKIYDEVERDPHTGAVLQARAMSVISKKWDVIAASKTNYDKDIAVFVKEKLNDMNFGQMRQELLKAILYGFYIGEVIWKISGDAIIPERVRAKHPRRFVFTTDRELKLITNDNFEGEALPDKKFIRFTYGSSDNPYGVGLGQKLWWPVWFKKNSIKFWMIFVDKFGSPTPVGKYPPGTTVELQQKLLDAIDAIQNESGIKIPDTMQIEFLEASRSGKATHQELCEYMDKQISKAVLGQTATTEGTPGKLGGDDAQNETRQDIVKADAILLDECLNNSIVKWIVNYNFSNITEYPKIYTIVEKGTDFKALSERDRILVKDVGLPISKEYFYQTYNIPAPEKGQQLVDAQESFGSFTDKQEDETEALLGKEVAPYIDKILNQAKQVVKKANSFKELKAKISKIKSDKEIKSIGEIMGRATLAASLSGRHDIMEKR